MDFSKNFLFIAPHPDDEVLGCGGLIKKINLMKGSSTVITVCNHMPPLYKKTDSIKTINEMKIVHKFLGVSKSFNLKYPACLLYKEPQYKINNNILNIIKKIKPHYIFLPFPDRHQDHRITFECSMVATRPKKDLLFIESVYSYEVLSETYWNASYFEPSFQPDVFINIDKQIKIKLKALKKYKSQISSKNYERAPESIEALAKFRGSQNGYKFAEAFKLIRMRLS